MASPLGPLTGDYFAPAAPGQGVKFDMTKYSWLGSAATESTLLAIRSDLPYAGPMKISKSKRTLIMGTQVPGTATYDNAVYSSMCWG